MEFEKKEEKTGKIKEFEKLLRCPNVKVLLSLRFNLDQFLQPERHIKRSGTLL